MQQLLRHETTMHEPAVVDALMAGLPAAEQRWCSLPGCDCRSARSALNREEWMAWFIRRSNQLCEGCTRAVRVAGSDGKLHLACDDCAMAWA